MLKRLAGVIFSTRLTAVLWFVFAGAMAVGTFIENDYGTHAAKAVIYCAPWFEWVMILLAVNFIGNIPKYRLWRKSKWSVLLFHVGFLVILVGAGITRFTGYEGIMRIREGQSSNILITDQSFLRLRAIRDNDTVNIERLMRLSPLTSNTFSMKTQIGDDMVEVHSVRYVPAAVQEIVPNTEGSEILSLVVAGEKGRQDIPLLSGEVMTVDGIQIGFNTLVDKGIEIRSDGNTLFVKATQALDFIVMADQRSGRIEADSLSEMTLRTLYRMGKLSIVPNAFYNKAKLEWTSVIDKEEAKAHDDVLIVDVVYDHDVHRVALRGEQGNISTPEVIALGDIQFELAFGPKPIVLPFSLYLHDFQLERYPGSNSPSAYASEVSIIDGDDVMPHRIFMNNVLDYNGHRFFQASYDSDEKGTVLSVNHDFWGTQITYLGYLILSLGMMWTLFGKGSYFRSLNAKLKRISVEKTALTIVALGIGFNAFAEEKKPGPTEIMALLNEIAIEREHANAFGELLVQDLDGRIKPINSLASEFLRKVAHTRYYRYRVGSEEIRLSADQVFLGMLADPNAWQDIPVIYIQTAKAEELTTLIGVNQDNYSAFADFLDENGVYKIATDVAIASQKKPGSRSEYDKEILRVDERFNILYNVFTGKYLRIFPLKGDSTNSWFSPVDQDRGFRGEDSVFVKSIMSVYFNSFQNSRDSGDWSKPDECVAYIATFQDVIGKEVIPSTGRQKGELLYNNLNLYFWLFQYYWTIGLVLLILALVKIFSRSSSLDLVWKISLGIAAIGFFAHAFNLALRSYVSGHAPWSDGYEMLIFVAWTLVLFGFLFVRRSHFTLPLALAFSGTLLFVSYLDWLSPEITNLVPVLKSYWLKVHVATIVSSYAPLALACLMGFFALCLMIFRNAANARRIDLSISEITSISQMSMTIGLFLLAIGTFLGGVWANESWGRYWGWDPKETWALISVVVYAFVLHMRLIPGLKGTFAINLASVVAFSSIVMTSFGVNYYLAGLHSYAKGDPVPIPAFTYWVVGIIAVVAILAAMRTRGRHL